MKMFVFAGVDERDNRMNDPISEFENTCDTKREKN